MNVLIVDDCIDTSDYISFIVTHDLGYTCQLARNYEDAVYKLEQMTFDVLLVDVLLDKSDDPGVKDGVDFINYAHATGPQAGIIIYSGLDYESLSKKLSKLQCKVDLMMSKPIVKEKLLHLLQQIAHTSDMVKNGEAVMDMKAVIEEHSEQCGKVNELTYAKKLSPITQIFSIVGVFALFVSALVTWQTLEAGQNSQIDMLEYNQKTIIQDAEKDRSEDAEFKRFLIEQHTELVNEIRRISK